MCFSKYGHESIIFLSRHYSDRLTKTFTKCCVEEGPQVSLSILEQSLALRGPASDGVQLPVRVLLRAEESCAARRLNTWNFNDNRSGSTDDQNLWF